MDSPYLDSQSGRSLQGESCMGDQHVAGAFVASGSHCRPRTRRGDICR